MKLPNRMTLTKENGQVVSDIPCLIEDGRIITQDLATTFEAGDEASWTLPNGSERSYAVTKVTPLIAGVPGLDHVQLTTTLRTAATPKLVPPKTASPSGVALFISHSAKDVEAATKLVALLTSAIDIRKEDIRCTSVEGCKLVTGVRTDIQLKDEIRATPAFIALLSRSSVTSGYVLFELGARWSGDLQCAPILLSPNTFSLLPGPLSGHHATRSGDRSGINQVLEETARAMGRKQFPPHSYEQELSAFTDAKEPSIPTPTAPTPKRPTRKRITRKSDEARLVAAMDIVERARKNPGRLTLDLNDVCRAAGLDNPSEDDFAAIVAELEPHGVETTKRVGAIVVLDSAFL